MNPIERKRKRQVGTYSFDQINKKQKTHDANIALLNINKVLLEQKLKKTKLEILLYECAKKKRDFYIFGESDQITDPEIPDDYTRIIIKMNTVVLGSRIQIIRDNGTPCTYGDPHNDKFYLCPIKCKKEYTTFQNSIKFTNEHIQRKIEDNISLTKVKFNHEKIPSYINMSDSYDVRKSSPEFDPNSVSRNIAFRKVYGMCYKATVSFHIMVHSDHLDIPNHYHY
jgi:hypothetical protein